MNGYIAKYLRISDDDIGEEKSESDSIGNQRKVLEYYIENHQELSGYPVKEFLDDGYSGVNFNRPGVQRLLKDVQGRKVACIIVKDLSRFGRNYIEVGGYVEQVFPFMGVRFISVSDNYDSSQNPAGIEIGFKNLIHDLYSRDLSRKVKSVKHLHQERGIYSGGGVPYGYRKKESKGAAYCPDPKAAEVVKKIFCLAAEGAAPVQIADELNKEMIFTPGAYKNQSLNQNYRLKNRKKNLWTPAQVRGVIQNEVYIGTYICHKSTSVRPREMKQNDRSEYLKFEHDHEALVGEELFLAAQAAIVTRGKRGFYKKEENPHALKGKIKCGCCGYGMVRGGRKTDVYYCRMGNGCGSRIKIETKELEEVVLKTLQKIIEVCQEQEKKRQDENGRKPGKISDAKEEKRLLEMKAGYCKAARLDLYQQWKEGGITKDAYILKRNELARKEAEFWKKRNILNQSMPDLSALAGEGDLKQGICFVSGIQKLTKKLADDLIERVDVYASDRIEITWKFIPAEKIIFF